MQTNKKKQLFNNLLKFSLLIFLGLHFTGPEIFAQEEDTKQIQIEEEHDTKNLDKLLIDYNKDQEKVLKDAAKILEKNEGDEIDVKPSEKLSVKKALVKPTYSESIKTALEPLQKMSEPELMTLLKENTKGSSAEKFVEYFPQMIVFAVRVIKDKDALPGLAKILDNKKSLIRLSSAMIATFIFGFILKKIMSKKGRSIAEAIGSWFLRFFIMTTLRLGITYVIFGAEIMPTVKVALKTFF